jgi:hypothetical protein
MMSALLFVYDLEYCNSLQLTTLVDLPTCQNVAGVRLAVAEGSNASVVGGKVWNNEGVT